MKIGLFPALAALCLTLPVVAYAQTEPGAAELPRPLTESPPPPPTEGGSEGKVEPVSPPPAVYDGHVTETPAPTSTPKYDYIRIGAGARIGSVTDRAFDTFASDNVLAQFSLDATYAFYTDQKFALAAGAAWDVGARESGARGISTRITVHRLTVPIEARWYFAPWLHGFAKVAPGAAAYAVRVRDTSSNDSLEQAPWVLAADLSVGASVRLGGTSDHRVRRPRLWATTEVGYGVTSNHSVRPKPSRDENDVLGTDQPVNLGSLSVSGAFLRAGLAFSF